MKAYLIISIMITDPAAHTQVIEYQNMATCRAAMHKMVDIHTESFRAGAPKYWTEKRLAEIIVRREDASFIHYASLNVSLTCSEK